MVSTKVTEANAEVGAGTAEVSLLQWYQSDPYAGLQDTARLYRSLKRLADDIYETASDLTGFGPYAEHKITALTGQSIESRIDIMREVLHELVGQLRKLRSEYLRDQLGMLGIDDRMRNLKLHIGCGRLQPDGWINIDLYPAPLSMAAGWVLPFGDGSVRHIVVSRLPEMLFYPVEFREFLGEVYRVLEPNGLLQILVDNRIGYQRTEPKSLELAYRHWTEETGHRTRLDYFLTNFGPRGAAPTSTPAHRRCDVSAWIHLLVDERFTGVTYSDAPNGRAGSEPDGEIGSMRRVGHRTYISARKPVH